VAVTWRSARLETALSLAFVAVSAQAALAFPGSVRWGYANCSTCHYNVAGGGVLTPYGRQLSRELLSTWGGEREAEFAYGTPSLPPWLALGGDVEYLVTEKAHGGTFRLVQADLEAAVTHGRLLAVATVGPRTDASDAMGEGVVSRRHYLQLTVNPCLSVRAGRFSPSYGVWNGDASTATRSGLGLDRDGYNVEANWITERFNASLTGIVAGTDGFPAERGFAATAGVFFAGKRKVWVSYMARHGPGLDRHAGGISGVFGFGRRAYLLAQADLQQLRLEGPEPTLSKELHTNLCLARETWKGLYVLLIDEMTRRHLGSPGRISHSYGSALRWFPRPHLELQVRWRKQDREAESPQFLDGFSGFIHFYP
jgi:hypothetical protein